jgi:hypothetical protein
VTVSGNIRVYDPTAKPSPFLESALEWSISLDEAWVRIVRPDDVVYEAAGANLWECLTVIRSECEPLGVRLCCNGARKDCYPSGMSVQMGGGYKVMIREMGRPVTGLHAVVKTFDPAELARVGTIKEQEQYYRSWLASLPLTP